jgi:preprotein translocase SecE subunit
MARQSGGATAAKPGIYMRSRGFLQEVRVEMSKVAWPTKDELKSHTTVVLLLLFLLAGIVGVYDFVFRLIVVLLLSL